MSDGTTGQRLASMVVAANGTITITAEAPTLPPRLTALLNRVLRRGILAPDDDEAPPPGWHYEPVSPENAARLADEVGALYPEVNLSTTVEIIGG